MASRRDQIKLDAAEIAAYLDASKTLVCASNGPHGRPHMAPLWYIMRDLEPWAWTFAKSQKAVNLGRDPHATILVEDGVTYDKLRGVMIDTDVKLITDTDQVRDFGIELFTKYGDGTRPTEPVIKMIDAQATKRVVMRFRPLRYVSWDHSKLDGVY